jgi:mRNA interferase MazF
MLVTRVQRWGNNQGLRLPKPVLDRAGIGGDDQVELVVSEHQILVKKVRPPKYDLAELGSRIPEGYKAEQVGFGPPGGKEEWQVPHYMPRKGDFITLSFDPQAGHEQRGRRPALVVSNGLFNRRMGLAIVCPITNTNRHFPFHIALPPASSLSGFVMVEQVKSVDYAMRRASSSSGCPPSSSMMCSN